MLGDLCERHDFGRPYPLALARWGLEPERVLLVEARDAGDVLWAMEEGLNAGALVIGEIGASARYDLSASRRRHRSAQACGRLLFTTQLACCPHFAALGRRRR